MRDATQPTRAGVGPFQIFTLAYGAVVGVGWMVVLGDWLTQAGPLGAMVGLASGGAVMIVIGLCYGEMAGLIPTSGGEMAFGYEVFGPKTSYLAGWLLGLCYVSVCAFEATSIGWIMSALIPGVEGPALYAVLGAPVQGGALALSLAATAVLLVLNVRGLEGASRFQDSLILSLLVLSVLFIVAGIGGGDVANLTPAFSAPDGRSVTGGVLAIFMTASFWFAGFNVVPQVMEERSSRASLRRVGQMIVLSIVVGVVFKTLVVLSSAMSMPWRTLATLDLPAAAAFEHALGSTWLAKAVLLAGLLGLLSTWNAILIAGSRLMLSMGRVHMISDRFARPHARFGTPSFALWFTTIVSLIGILLGRNALIPIVNLSSTCLAFGFLITCLGVVRLRGRWPLAHRPYTVPGGVVTGWIGAAGAAFSLGLSLYQPYKDANGALPLEWIVLAVWLTLGAIFWRWSGARRATMSPEERRRIIVGPDVPPLGVADRTARAPN
jgi:amino acid transporter